MNLTKHSTTITLWANRLIALFVAVLLFIVPGLVRWYSVGMPLTDNEFIAIIAAFYPSAAITFFALWNVDVLLRNILGGQVFIADNVTRIRRIRWGCAGVTGICFPAAVVYPPLTFVVVIMGFLCLMVNVICQVMKAAVTIREENDLTI